MTDPMELVGLVEQRIGQDFDGECHLTETEARQIAACIREMVEWRDIETAPRDGTHILIAPHMDVALWDHGAERWITNVIPLNSDRTIADDWRARPVMMFEQYASNWGIEPTHWLPLPPAPGAEDE
ncbi:hypothetical protein D3C80_1564680 [compost metagenome]